MNYSFNPNINGRQILAIGQEVLYHGQPASVCHIHPCGLINLKKKNEQFYIFCIHPNMCIKTTP